MHLTADPQVVTFSEGLDQNFDNKLHQKTPDYGSRNDNLSSHFSPDRYLLQNNSHLSTSLSPHLSDIYSYLSTTDFSTNHSPDHKVLMPDQFLFGHPQSLEVHRPFGEGSSSQFMMVPHASLPSLPWGTQSFTPHMLKRETLAKKSRAHSFKFSKKLATPHISPTEKPISTNERPVESGSSIITKDLSNLHWSSPAAKTRAARKRRMVKYYVPIQSSSPLQASTKTLPWSSSVQDTPIEPTIEKQVVTLLASSFETKSNLVCLCEHQSRH